MRSKNKIKKILIITAPLLICLVTFFAMIAGDKVKYEGSSRNGLWVSTIEKSDKTSIGPNYFLNLYWQGNKKEAKRTIVEKITLYIDGKKYDDRENYDLSE